MGIKFDIPNIKQLSYRNKWLRKYTSVSDDILLVKHL